MRRTHTLGLALGLALLGCGSSVAAQASGRVAGYIIDQTGLAVADVSVSATGPAPATSVRKTLSDRRGAYGFDGLPPGSYRVAFGFEGFQRQERTVSVGAGAAVTVTLMGEVE